MPRLTFPKIDGRSKDLDFTWFTAKYGDECEAWRSYAADYLCTKKRNVQAHHTAIILFLERYLVQHNLSHDPAALFGQPDQLPDLMAVILKTYKHVSAISVYTHIVDFID